MKRDEAKLSGGQVRPEREEDRDLDKEREDYLRMINRQSEASRLYASGKFRSA